MQKIVTTVAIMASGFVASKILDLVWRKAFGHKPPMSDDQDSSLREVVLFAAASGVIAALARRGATNVAAKVAPKPLTSGQEQTAE
ncbi:DUF4235 domain-containing protein [Serinibacter salmoneus]|uniref:Uncharacterized protein DUF4235 n=1 Tax=Serinibacter salmoneus TaxID=556530 RepID=A0A2A9CVZ7_9MICO|nr:DUF4235 domain-containing protein [Serinibacter salmoneus]PFG18594.1 uncharacterized protein DUF4235 [Serinibacter salmoneus]